MDYKRFTKATKMLWRDKVTITQFTSVKDGLVNKNKRVVIAEDKPCKIIKPSLSPDKMNNGVNEESYNAVLLLDNDIKVPSGATMLVTDVNGNTRRYKQATSGYTNYVSHQELAVMYDEKA
ncbi:hypothetical protein [Apilactobacillus xinyiensis]|uniref:hypothetical protein n=1 Tax=Apilactobacillus xinyiensis TaxID=2841032 RepID=UPI00200CD801|nr:hypothetical protein [Apilactobacillus xinyiensis]MCL0319379.1 hypothetical protein [Apilactobacillus xinyiensis]